MDEYLNIWPTVRETRSRALVKKYFDSAISTVVVVSGSERGASMRSRREIIYRNAANLNFRRIERCRVCCRGTCQKDCGNARPGKS